MLIPLPLLIWYATLTGQPIIVYIAPGEAPVYSQPSKTSEVVGNCYQLVSKASNTLNAPSSLVSVAAVFQRLMSNCWKSLRMSGNTLTNPSQSTLVVVVRPITRP